MLTIDTQTITIFPTKAKAAALAAKLIADDDGTTDYQVVANKRGFFVAIFEDGEMVFTL